MPRFRPCLICIVAILAAVAGSVRTAAAQVSIPNIQNPINKAKAAAAKTSEQIRAAERAGADSKGASAGPGPAAAAQAADQQKKAGPASQKAAPAQGKAAAKPGAKVDETAQSVASRRGQVTIYREAFAYNSGGRRDPFISLMLSGELRPIVTDLILTGVIYDPEGRRSIALLVDGSTGESYRVRANQTLGRMKVTKIGMQDITFSIDEFGLSRSETLIIDKTRKGPVSGQRRP